MESQYVAHERGAAVRWALRASRLQRKWTQHQAAKALGVSRSFYSMIETNRRNPTLHLARRIADLFGLDLDTLFF
ncbi:MAG: helix-turn-helix transcriptional regulator [Bacillota bacterium]